MLRSYEAPKEVTVSSTTAALLGALIGAVTALVSATITNVVALRNERARQDAAKQATYVEALRRDTAVAFTELFAIQHAINWITWFAENDPRAIDNEMIASYNSETHGAYPRLLGAMAAVAALNLRVYQELRPLMQEVYDLEEHIALALRGVNARRDRDAAMLRLRDGLRKAYALERRLPPELARIMEIAQSESRP
jgi:hypothetical protein